MRTKSIKKNKINIITLGISKNKSFIELQKTKKIMKGVTVFHEVLAFSSKDFLGLTDTYKCLEKFLSL